MIERLLLFKPKNIKISCISVLPKNLRDIIDSYLQQSWNNKELIILDRQRSKYVDILDREDIRFHIPDQNLTIGALKNLAIQIATGEVICNWENKCHSRRLVTQFSTLKDMNVYHKGVIDGRMVSVMNLPKSMMFYKQEFFDKNQELYDEQSNTPDECLFEYLSQKECTLLDEGWQYIINDNEIVDFFDLGDSINNRFALKIMETIG